MKRVLANTTRANRRAFLKTSAAAVGSGMTIAAIAAEVPSCKASASHELSHPLDGTQSGVQDDTGVILEPTAYTCDVMQGFPPAKEKRVTFQNWFDSTTRIRWTHLHSDYVFKSIAIPRDTSPVWILPRQMLDYAKIAAETVRYGFPAKEAEELSVEEWLRRSDTDAFLILHDGRIMMEMYFGDMTPYTRHHTWCGPKSILTTMMAPFVFNGEVPLDAKASRYVPELNGTGFEDATIHHLLNQTTSLEYYPEYPPDDPRWQTPEWQYNYGSPEFRNARHLLAQDLRIQGTFPLLPGEESIGLYDFVTSLNKGRKEHGETWSYNDSNTTALQWILERHTGVSCFEHFRRLWNTLGAEQMATVTYDSAATLSLPAATSITARDYARWGQMMLNRGRVGGGQVVPGIRELVRHMEEHPTPLGQHGYLTGNQGYQMHFWTDSTREQATTILRARGGYHNSCTVDLERGNVVVQFATYWDRDPDKLPQRLRDKEHVDSNENALIDFVTRILPTFVS